MIKFVDDALDRVTMYRLVLYYLAGLVLAAFGLALVGALPIDPTKLAFSAGLALLVCWLTNTVFARVYAAPENRDSVLITALILTLIMTPAGANEPTVAGALVFAAVWAMASKYILAVGRKHVLNPAAFGVLLTGLLLDQPPSWWIAGNIAMLPFVIVGGVLVVRKLRRADYVVAALLAAAATVVATTAPGRDWTALVNTAVYSPLLFLVFVMLTEPTTTPPQRWPRIAYGAIVGALAAPNIHIGGFFFTPEAALVLGNLFAFAVSPKRRFALTLQRIERSAGTAYDFVFGSDRALAFRPGQYLEFALAVPHSDSRGSRRFFTIASAPTEETVRLGVRFNEYPSAFKRALADMKPGDTIYASQLAGDFVLPSRRSEKLAFLAGGIGITPFRSMLQCLIDHNEPRPITVLYAADRREDFAYRDVIEHARRELGIRVAYAVAQEEVPGIHHGFIDEALVKRAVPDYLERTFYVSGPRAMVVACRDLLHRLGVPRSRVKVDFFPGLA